MADMDQNQSLAMDRDRGRRGDRGTRFSDADGKGRERSRDNRSCTRIYVSNVPYEYRWQEMKDLFRQEVGDVEFVELFNDENNKPRGCGIVEFKSPESVQTALEKMNKYEINGRQIVIKEDYGNERDKYGRVVRNSGGGGGGGGGANRRDNNRDDDRMAMRGGYGGGGGGNIGGMGDYNTPMNTYGLSTTFLEGLGIHESLHSRIFVANLDYKVDEKKLREVFRLAGRIINLELSTDKDGNSRGFAVIEYDHPVEAVQAISMFDHQMLFERRMTVRLDRERTNEGFKMPEGLRGIGIGLGPNGEPLKDVARNLPNLQQNTNTCTPTAAAVSSMLGAGSNAGNLLSAVGGTNLQGLSSNLAALSSVVGNLSSTNPILSSATANLGLGLNSNNDGPNQSSNSFQASANSFGSGFGGGSNSRNDFEMGTSNNSVRSYNTRPSEDFNRSGNGGFNSNMAQRKSDTIIIKNLPPSCTWQTLRDKLRDIGEVTFAELRGVDTGVVRFAKERDAECAINLMDGSRFEGRTVSVTYF